MTENASYRWSLIPALAAVLALGTAATAAAQNAGQARVVASTVAGPLGSTTTTLADTGTLGGDAVDARNASQPSGSVPLVLSGNTLHAATIGWLGQVVSEASIADLAVTVAGSTIGADFVMSRAQATAGGGGAGSANIDGLSINGLPIDVTGEPNQTIAIPGGRVVINEQQADAASSAVNGLHIIVSGVADIVVASASASVQ